MKALILAAGFGSRLENYTQNMPKALVHIHDIPILRSQIDSLLNYGIEEIFVVVGYRGDMIIEFVDRHYSTKRINIINNYDFADTNSAYSFWLAYPHLFLDESYIHLNCDILFSGSLLEQLIKSPENNIIFVRQDLKIADGMENVELYHGVIKKMEINTFPKASAKAFGLAKISQESAKWNYERISNWINSGNLKSNYFGAIREGVKIQTYHALTASAEELLEVNTVDDFIFATETWGH